jgi:hypothetical protein
LFFTHPQPLFGALAVDAALNLEQCIDALDRLQGDRRDRCGILVAPCIGGDVRQFKKLPPGMGPTCVRTSPGKEEECDLKPFNVTQRVRRPPGKGGARQPEASLAWVTATSFVKRRQRVLKPCGSLEIM